jgi:predicted Rossmann-fold nucleotide-binding protein
MKDFPVVLIGQKFWAPLRQQIEERFVDAKTIDPDDMKTLFFTDSPLEAAEFIQAIATKKFELRVRPHKILGEHKIGQS